MTEGCVCWNNQLIITTDKVQHATLRSQLQLHANMFKSTCRGPCFKTVTRLTVILRDKWRIITHLTEYGYSQQANKSICTIHSLERTTTSIICASDNVTYIHNSSLSLLQEAVYCSVNVTKSRYKCCKHTTRKCIIMTSGLGFNSIFGANRLNCVFAIVKKLILMNNLKNITCWKHIIQDRWEIGKKTETTIVEKHIQLNIQIYKITNLNNINYLLMTLSQWAYFTEP